MEGRRKLRTSVVKKVLATLRLEERELAAHGFSLFSSWQLSPESFQIPDDVRRRIKQDMKVNDRNLARVEKNISESRAQLCEEKRKRKARAYLNEAQEKTRFGRTIPSQYRQSNQDKHSPRRYSKICLPVRKRPSPTEWVYRRVRTRTRPGASSKYCGVHRAEI